MPPGQVQLSDIDHTVYTKTAIVTRFQLKQLNLHIPLRSAYCLVNPTAAKKLLRSQLLLPREGAYLEAAGLRVGVSAPVCECVCFAPHLVCIEPRVQLLFSLWLELDCDSQPQVSQHSSYSRAPLLSRSLLLSLSPTNRLSHSLPGFCLERWRSVLAER
jgi:hypothetical protein